MTKKGLLAISILLIFSSMSWAACPNLEQLPTIQGVGEFNPSRVAVGGSGETFVSDYVAGKVSVFTKEGQLLDSLRVKKPLGIALDSAGNLYVGSVKPRGKTSFIGKVDIYGPDLRKISSLVSYGEGLQYPMDIEIAGGKVYVVDTRANLVSIYSEADGASLGSFGGYGSTPGSLVTPLAISFDPQSGNLFVTDRALQLDAANNKTGMGAGLHVFTADGVYVSSLPVAYADNAPAGTVPMVVPSGVHVDAAGNVFVTDSTLGDLVVMDTAGELQCRVSLGATTKGPQGAYVSPDGRLLIATSAGLMGYATDNHIDMSVTPGELNIAEQECSASGSSATLSVLNNGGGLLDWTATSNAAWLGLSSASGQVNGKGAANVTVTIDTAALAAGKHEGVLTFVSQSGTADIAVTVNSYGAPTLSVAESGLNFDVTGDVMPNSDILNITLTGDVVGGMTWTASAANGWLNVSPSSGDSGTLSTAQVGIDSAGLTALSGGTHTGSVTVSAGCPSVSDVVVPITLTYIKGGTISITSNTEDATYEVTGPASFSGSGDSFLIPVVPPGTYTVKFGAVQGFKSPASYTLDIDYGQTADVAGSYIDLRENNKIIVSMAAGDSAADDALEIFNNDGTAAGGFVVSEAVGGAAGQLGSFTAAGDVDGDGVDEIIVSNGKGNISIYEADGTLVYGAFEPFSEINTGVAIEKPFTGYVIPAAADIDGDGRDEIILTSGSSPGDPADVVVYGFDGVTLFNTGIFNKAYRKDMGANVAKGDVNGDGIDEFITVSAAAADVERVIEVRIFGADTSQGAGAWKMRDIITFNKGLTYEGASVTSGDLNADGIDEIIVTGVAADGADETEFNIYNVAGSLLGSFSVSGTGLYVAAGDIDFDGSAEIIVGDGSTSGSSNVRVYDAAGSLRKEFNALEGQGLNVYVSGAKISLGQIVGN